MFPKTPRTSVYLVHERKNRSNIFAPLATPAGHRHEASPCPASLTLGHLTPAHHTGLPPACGNRIFTSFQEIVILGKKLLLMAQETPVSPSPLRPHVSLARLSKRSSSRGSGNEHQHGRHTTGSAESRVFLTRAPVCPTQSSEASSQNSSSLRKAAALNAPERAGIRQERGRIPDPLDPPDPGHVGPRLYGWLRAGYLCLP